MASSLELNKLLAGVLTAGIIGVGAAVFSGLLYSPRSLEEHAFSVVVSDDAADVADAEAVEEPSIEMLLASADPSAGQTITRQCTACHVFDEGGENRVGPVLWDVVGRDVASVSGFSYSAALQEIEGEWTFAALDGFLANPRGWAPGTSMSYAGLRSAEDRANLIAYLREQSNDPVSLPEPDAETAEAAPVEEADAAPVEEAVADEPAEAEAVEEDVAAAEAPAEAETVVEETAEAVETAVSEATETVVEEAEEVAAAAGEVVEEVAETAETAAGEVAATATEMVEAAEETVAEVAEETADVATDVVDETEEAAEEVAAEATNGAETSAMVAMVAAADPANGERNFRQCAACHTPDEGGGNRVGPNLWGVFGADVGSKDGFNYSDALTSIDGIWTVDKLNAYLENPRGFAPGNRMAFAGLRGEEDRAAMIAYLRSLSEDPKPVDIQ